MFNRFAKTVTKSLTNNASITTKLNKNITLNKANNNNIIPSTTIDGIEQDVVATVTDTVTKETTEQLAKATATSIITPTKPITEQLSKKLLRHAVKILPPAVFAMPYMMYASSEEINNWKQYVLWIIILSYFIFVLFYFCFILFCLFCFYFHSFRFF